MKFNFVTWWGAILSTLLAILRFYEFWRDRFRIDVEAYFTTLAYVGNSIFISNLNKRPIIVKHWKLFWISGNLLYRKKYIIAKNDVDSYFIKIDESETKELMFKDENYFDWMGGKIKGIDFLFVYILLV